MPDRTTAGDGGDVDYVVLDVVVDLFGGPYGIVWDSAEDLGRDHCEDLVMAPSAEVPRRSKRARRLSKRFEDFEL